MSGAGKSSVLKMLEDAGYFCVDNLPIQLVKKFVRLILQGKQSKVALGWIFVVDMHLGSWIMY